MLGASIKRIVFDPYVLAKACIFLALAYLCLGQILPAMLSMWETTHTVSTLNLTPAMRAEVLDALADKVARRYLDAGQGARMAAALRQAQREGRYDDIVSPGEFARILTHELRDAGNDTHLQVQFQPGGVPDFPEQNFPPPRKDELSLPARLVDRIGRSMASFGVEQVQRSDAGIGYIRLTGFVRPELSAEKYAAAMDRMKDTRALIIDLRRNGGGSRDAVALLASYFFDRPTLLSEVVAPRSGERLQMWTRRELEGRHYGARRPVYILTSRATFSAGEDFAYAMQTRKRAIIVGEPTRGGAHPIAPFRLDAHFLALVPVAQTISPVTHTNWEGAGVQPDIAVPADRAQSTATIAILAQQLAVESDAGRRARIRAWLAEER